MERAGIYARVSVKHYNRKDLTIENQVLTARRYIKMCILIKVFLVWIFKGLPGKGLLRI